MARKPFVAPLGQRLARAARTQRIPRATHGDGASSGPEAPTDARKLYLDLLERAVTHTLYFPPDTRPAPRYVREAFERELAEMGIDEATELTDRERREQGRDWPVYAQTMVGRKRIRNVRECVETALAEGVPGDLIEAGCWRGGTAIMMRGILKAHDVRDRTVFAADSFEGLPKPNPERFPADAADMGYTAEELRVSVAEVRNNFARYGLFDRQVQLLQGWFRDTLPTVRERSWAVVRLDGDLYESTMDGLVNLYPGLSPGGYLIVDDYAWPNCRAAVEDFRREHAIGERIERIDCVGAFWRKAT